MLVKPNKNAIIYEDKKVYSCLANFPIVKGHVVVVWKKRARDLHLLNKKEYEYLMKIVNEIRNAMLKTLKIKKIYLIYADEVEQVHWHLVPGYSHRGFNIFLNKPKKLKNFKLDDEIRKNLKI